MLPDDSDYFSFRQQEVLWLRTMHDHVTSMLPPDATFDPTMITANEAALHAVELDSAFEAVMTSQRDKQTRRKARKAALVDCMIESPMTPSAAPPTAPLWGKSLNTDMLRRVFTSVHRFRAYRDDRALSLAARVVDRMLSLRRPRMLRCLLRNFLDDAMMLLRTLYPTLENRRKGAFPDHLLAPPDDPRTEAEATTTAPACGVQRSPPFLTLRKLSCHMGAIDDLLDAVVPPCDDSTFCGLQEFSERLNAMLAIEVCSSRVLESACNALRLLQTSGDDTMRVARLRDRISLWRLIHECVTRLLLFISSHCEGDDDEDDSMSDTEGGSTATSSSAAVPEENATEKESWRGFLREAAKGAKLFGCICFALESGVAIGATCDESSGQLLLSCKRLSVMTLRCLTQDKESLRLLQETCLGYPHVWDYLLPCLVQPDLCLRQEAADCVLALLSNQDGDAAFHGTQLTWCILRSFQDRLLACIDISAVEHVGPHRHETNTFVGNSSSQSLSLAAELLYALDLAGLSTNTESTGNDKPLGTGVAAADIDTYSSFHASAVALIVDKICDVVAEVSHHNGCPSRPGVKRQRDGDELTLQVSKGSWRAMQPLLADLLQHLRRTVVHAKKERHRAHFPNVPSPHTTAHPSPVEGQSLIGRLCGSLVRGVTKRLQEAPKETFPLLDRLIPAATRARLVEAVHTLVRLASAPRQRPALLHGVCMELLSTIPTDDA